MPLETIVRTVQCIASGAVNNVAICSVSGATTSYDVKLQPSQQWTWQEIKLRKVQWHVATTLQLISTSARDRWKIGRRHFAFPDKIRKPAGDPKVGKYFPHSYQLPIPRLTDLQMKNWVCPWELLFDP